MLLDTIGFITNLPHDLVDSFKSTLEEVASADVVLHVRDISHPHTEQQKQTVLEVLKDLKFDQSFYSHKMIEVWNKIDLLQEPIKYSELAFEDAKVVPVSAIHKTNIEKLMQLMEGKVNEMMGRELYVCKHGIPEHGDRLRWLNQ